MKPQHKCPQCLSLTSKAFYCEQCTTELKRPPRITNTRIYVPIPDLSVYGTVYGRKEDRKGLR